MVLHIKVALACECNFLHANCRIFYVQFLCYFCNFPFIIRVSQIHMDLQPLVAKFYPEHLSSTWNNKVLIPEDRDYFFKSTLDLPKWREATVSSFENVLLLFKNRMSQCTANVLVTFLCVGTFTAEG